MSLTNTSTLFVIASLVVTGGIFVPTRAFAQEVSELTFVSDQQTQWNNNGTWEPAVLANQHPAWPSLPGARWIWNHEVATPDQQTLGDTVTFRRVFTVPGGMVAQGTITVMADNTASVLFNDTEIGTACFSTDSECFREFSFTGEAGENVLTFIVTNSADPLAQDDPFRNPAGFIFKATVTLEAADETPDPIVLVPGITVSQNKELLYEDRDGDDWKFAFLFNVYKGLIKKLESAGYEEGDDLRVAHYDWRQPAAHNAETYLKPMIEQIKQDTGASKVDVVAHSFGGVVARAYIQGDQFGNDVDQLVTLGSPHEGAADSYVAWEGGSFPEGWKFFVRNRVSRVEQALKRTRDQRNIRRPESFRAFFPSLRDMLPLNAFVARGDSVVPTEELAEQNLFLRGLRATLSAISARGVDLVTIAGTNVPTLGQVGVVEERTREDTLLARWRDGHAQPDPPVLNSEEGDARVLLANAHIGEEVITLSNAVHHKLPDEAQDEVFQVLGLEPEPSFFSEFPERVFGITILSPIEAVIEGPEGRVLSGDYNDFGEETAEYDDDPTDPDDPVDITIGDPPEGEYRITYTGTGDGDYRIITTYADEDETVSSVRDGVTFLGETIVDTVLIGSETSSLVDDEDYITLLEEVVELAKEAQLENVLSGQEQGRVVQIAQQARNDLRRYEEWTEARGESAAVEALQSYYAKLRELKEVAEQWEGSPEREVAAREVTGRVEKIRRYSPPL